MMSAEQNRVDQETEEKAWYSASIIVDFPHFSFGRNVAPVATVREIFLGSVMAADIEGAAGLILKENSETIGKLEFSVRPVLRVTRGKYDSPPLDVQPDMKVLLQ